MTKSVKFIEAKLEELAQHHYDVTVKYGFDYKSEIHIVELTPTAAFYENDNLLDSWIPISVEFKEMFPFEDICFISSDSSLALESYTFVLNEEKSEESKLLSELYRPYLESEFVYSFVDSVLLEGFALNGNLQFFNASKLESLNLAKQPFEQNNCNNDFDDYDGFLMAA